ncbi:hypothetical protein P280DRAFT_547111 [Massarina eburnea CBS 473.64]|uniref:Uncharacterized protein n=1 Tax=Massarina eburnea CBS 473.64 TaxID=1395130 RepID=A0A6A6SC63_9PLEO|nr:hypothetical protein P280DRAFT_547111 [Massarina eburnea CBS 473.64]
MESQVCDGPAINEVTISLIKEFEGFVKAPAPDPVGLPTAGYGHLCKTKGCAEVPYAFPLTKEMAAKLFMDDVMYGALVSFTPNDGIMNFKSSSLLRWLNAGENELKVVEELPKWNKAGIKPFTCSNKNKAKERGG